MRFWRWYGLSAWSTANMRTQTGNEMILRYCIAVPINGANATPRRIARPTERGTIATFDKSQSGTRLNVRKRLLRAHCDAALVRVGIIAIVNDVSLAAGVRSFRTRIGHTPSIGRFISPAVLQTDYDGVCSARPSRLFHYLAAYCLANAVYRSATRRRRRRSDVGVDEESPVAVQSSLQGAMCLLSVAYVRVLILGAGAVNLYSAFL